MFSDADKNIINEAIDRKNTDVVLILENGIITLHKQTIGLYDFQKYGKNSRLLCIVELMSRMLAIDIYGKNGPHMFKEPFEEEMFMMMKKVIEKHHLGKEDFYGTR